MKFKIVLSLFALITLSCTSSSLEKDTNTKNMDTTKTAVLALKIDAQLGEGAFWNAATQELLWIDIERKQLHLFNPATNKNRSFPTPSRIGTVVPSGLGRVLVALEDGMYWLDTNTGALELFTAVEADLPENRFNDGKCDPAGRLWVGSMHLQQKKGKANLYKIESDGTATKMLDNLTISNGIVWTKDAKTMFYIDTPTSTIQAFDYDKTTGTISNGRVAVQVDQALGFPDGMAIDEEDMLWVGLWNGNALGRFNPKTGALISKVEVPAHNVTACAFGGKDLDVLYITTASVDMSDAERAAFPDAGSVFKVKLDIKGVESPHFLVTK